MAEEGLTEDAIFEQRSEGDERGIMKLFTGSVCQKKK